MDPDQPGSDYVGPTGPTAFIRVPSGIEHPVRPLPVLGSGGLEVQRGRLRVTNHVEDVFITLSLPVRRERNGRRKSGRRIDGAPADRRAVCHRPPRPAPVPAPAATVPQSWSGSLARAPLSGSAFSIHPCWMGGASARTSGSPAH